ncbi:hypothetical protein [uncultured Desulfosarcina sp.]|uniref:hypothetical protein n=1 Tax=uncultured Desulfosarcina sp. TaxID=218289 RepID=UPI0029C8474B|nr:hypothetical protein [uncultured Desulfosarcina sp.]
MKTIFPCRLFPVLLLTAMIAMLVPATAAAHSTKGRLRIPLAKEAIVIDDVAYFVESYVHRELYKTRYAKSKNRFYVRDFIAVDQKGDEAEIRFVVLDNKEKTTFPDAMRIRRNDDGVWTYLPQGSDMPLEMYTYVQKWGFYYQRYIFPASAAGILVSGVLLFFLRRQKHSRKRAACEA